MNRCRDYSGLDSASECAIADREKRRDDIRGDAGIVRKGIESHNGFR
jgi:hypothetical protein